MSTIISYSEILSWYSSTKRFAIGLLSWLLPKACFLAAAKTAELSIIVWSNPRLSLIQRSKSAYCVWVRFVDCAIVNRPMAGYLREGELESLEARK
jgi:hypothetical protein